MDKSIDCKQLVEVKCDWLSNVDGMDIEDCIAVRLHQPGCEIVEV